MPIKGNADEVFHAWAHNRPIDYSNPRKSEPCEAGSVSRNCSGELYSYAMVIGLRVSERVFLVSSEKPSITTAKHIDYANRAAFGTVFSVPNMGVDKDSIRENFDYLLEQVRKAAYSALNAGSEDYFRRALLELQSFAGVFKVRRKFDYTLEDFRKDFDKDKAQKRADSIEKARDTRERKYSNALELLEWLKGTESSLLPAFLDGFSRCRYVPSVVRSQVPESLLARCELAATKYRESGKLSGYDDMLRLCKRVEAINDKARGLRVKEYRDRINALKSLLDHFTNPQMEKFESTLGWRAFACLKDAERMANSGVLPALRSANVVDWIARAALLPSLDHLGDAWSVDTEKLRAEDFQALEDLFLLEREVNRPFREIREVYERELREKQEREAMERNRERVEAWRNGALNLNSYSIGLPTMLRVFGDNVQTSHGASVPVKLARYLWPKLLAYKAGELSAEDLPRQWGAFQFFPDMQPKDKSLLVVGCHRIPWTEIEIVAELLELNQPCELSA